MSLLVRPLEAARGGTRIWGRWIALALLSNAAAFYLKKATDIDLRMWQVTLALFVFFSVASPFLNGGHEVNRFRFLYSSIPAILLAVHLWFVHVFGLFDVGAFLFHWQVGISGFGLTSAQAHSALRYAGYCFLFIACLHYLAYSSRRLVLLDRFLFVPLLLASPIVQSSMSFTYHQFFGDGERLIEHYRHASGARLPRETHRINLIIIYAESTERTFREIRNGHDLFADMDAVATKGTNFIGVRQAANTGWSMAGVVASQCGVPLQPLGLYKNNNFETVESFLPGAVCLGDVLAPNGYKLGFMTTASLQFAGSNIYLRQHSYDAMWGRESFEGEKAVYPNVWGVNDDTMFEFAFDRIAALNTDQQPFALSLQTIGGHFPEGFPTESCRAELTQMDQPPILYSIRCMGYEIRRFVERLDAAGYLKDTVVVILSDHLSMKTAVWDEINQHDRMNYVAILGLDEKKEIMKSGTMVDIYPTILEALGFHVPEHQAGIGVSLLSPAPTLSEKLGLENFNAMITNDNALALKIWSEGSDRRQVAVTQ